MASKIGNSIAASVAISLGKRVLVGEEIEKCAHGVDAELKELRETLDWIFKTGATYMFHQPQCEWQTSDNNDACNCRVARARVLIAKLQP